MKEVSPLTGGQGVTGSNPVIPTIFLNTRKRQNVGVPYAPLIPITITFLRLGKVETIEIHHLVPGSYKVTHERLL
jgi:hypothetical protein